MLAQELEMRNMEEDADQQLRVANRHISTLEHTIKTVREENNVSPFCPAFRI